ncbi:hypothetical protein [Spirosoma radiotolerans]|uniref:DUF4136 domain-containing protein n=1 Tax=Spirosoma radiotolerans TaxID=1379870 RepID=A0A0E3V9F8_9BACT|nr:hypothetical protein [Spirosoma radiotolerans]AKD57632.1 hypothetical protein SD10_24790 [Spirosoma radiotolerans]
MKTLFTLFLLTVGFSALAQRSSSKQITNDGRQLRIRIDIEQPDRSIHYRRSFDVSEMDESAVKALENHIVDSLDRASSDAVSMRNGKQKHENQRIRKATEEHIVYSSGVAETQADRMEANASSSLSPSDVAPSSVLVREDKENGRLWMQYTFQKDGEELVIERTANVVGKTEREKQAIIRETERSFGIKTGNQ